MSQQEFDERLAEAKKQAKEDSRVFVQRINDSPVDIDAIEVDSDGDIIIWTE